MRLSLWFMRPRHIAIRALARAAIPLAGRRTVPGR